VRRKRPCKQCPLLQAEIDLLQKQLGAVTYEAIGMQKGQGEELAFYRKAMTDLIDDYLIRRNPFKS
jgi:hypothetical protein